MPEARSRRPAGPHWQPQARRPAAAAAGTPVGKAVRSVCYAQNDTPAPLVSTTSIHHDIFWRSETGRSGRGFESSCSSAQAYARERATCARARASSTARRAAPWLKARPFRECAACDAAPASSRPLLHTRPLCMKPPASYTVIHVPYMSPASSPASYTSPASCTCLLHASVGAIAFCSSECSRGACDAAPASLRAHMRERRAVRPQEARARGDSAPPAAARTALAAGSPRRRPRWHVHRTQTAPPPGPATAANGPPSCRRPALAPVAPTGSSRPPPAASLRPMAAGACASVFTPVRYRPEARMCLRAECLKRNRE
jgi:hypothetical protein